MKKIIFFTTLIFYLLLIWVVPIFVLDTDNFFIGFQKLLSIIGLGFLNSFLVYLLIVIPSLCILVRILFLPKYPLLSFITFFILLPYMACISFFIYAYQHALDNFSPL